MPDFQETLRRLARRFAARDIMTPQKRLETGSDQDDAVRKLQKYPEYDVIPIRQGGRLVAFLERGSPKQKVIQIQHVVSTETPILDLVDSLCDCRFTFVHGRHEVVGLVCVSDLNDPVVKLPYFVLLEGVERQVADSLRTTVTDDTISRLRIDSDRLTGLRNRKARLRREGVDRDWVTLLYFRELLDAAVHLGKVELSEQHIEPLAAVRNRIVHTDKELVETPADVRTLGSVRDVCTDLLLRGREQPA
jgi:hypothetical protein